MNKRIIVNDDVMFVKARESGTRLDAYYGRKALDNKDRGHYAIENDIVICDRPATALIVTASGSGLVTNVSGSIVLIGYFG